jgi:hypothetical protein
MLASRETAGLKVIVSSQFEQPRMKADGIS